MKYRMTKAEREARTAARWRLINEVNQFKMRNRPTMAPVLLYGMKDIQRAVWYARKFMVVDANLLRAAGYKPKALKPGKPVVLKRLIGS